MPVSPLDGPPFRGRHAATLTRIVGTVRSVLDPDSVEMEYLFEPSGQRKRWPEGSKRYSISTESGSRTERTVPTMRVSVAAWRPRKGGPSSGETGMRGAQLSLSLYPPRGRRPVVVQFVLTPGGQPTGCVIAVSY